MKQLRLMCALALAGALGIAGSASAQTASAAPAGGEFIMSIHTHSDQMPPLRFGPVQQLPFNATAGSTFLYSSRRCEDPAPYNDVGLVMNPDVGGLTSPLRVRHRVRGTVTAGNAEAGTVEGDTTSVRCLAPSPAVGAPGTGGPETADAIHTTYRAEYRRESANVLRFVGSFTITGGEGTFAGITGGGTFEGAFVCLGALRFPATQPTCEQRGHYTDFTTLRGNLIAPAGQHDPGVRGTYAMPSAPMPGTPADTTPLLAPGAIAPATPPAAAAIVRKRGRLSAAVTPSSDLRPAYVFRTSGRLTLPAGVSKAAGCKGRISVQVKRGAVTISTRRPSLTSNCTYSSRVTFANKRRFGTAAKLKFTVRFRGNARISPAIAPVRFARVRR